jgi:predicted flavoprotein YhiN
MTALRSRYDLIVIGAGPAGLAAAISFKRKCTGSVLMIDSQAEAGKKILATGNGRCNLSNVKADGYEQLRLFFEGLGVLIYTDESGRAYPHSRQASVVRDALVFEAERLGTEFLLSAKVNLLAPGDEDDFIVETEAVQVKGSSVAKNAQAQFRARQVIVATGGKACPVYGNFGDGFRFARKLGIEVTPIRPALVPLVYTAEGKKSLSVLKGVRARVDVVLLSDDHPVATASGEVQFTDYGLSGICIFDLSRYLGKTGGDKTEGQVSCPDGRQGNGHRYEVQIDFAPGISCGSVRDLLERDAVAGLAGVVDKKLAAILKPEQVKRFTVPVSGTRGWKDAQITAGGVSMNALDAGHYEVTSAPGLFFAGEVCDYDGPSGGFNLDHAFTSGLAAGSRAGGFCAYYTRNKT